MSRLSKLKEVAAETYPTGRAARKPAENNELKRPLRKSVYSGGGVSRREEVEYARPVSNIPSEVPSGRSWSLEELRARAGREYRHTSDRTRTRYSQSPEMLSRLYAQSGGAEGLYAESMFTVFRRKCGKWFVAVLCVGFMLLKRFLKYLWESHPSSADVA
eukprot:TRINITY_DN12876_c0_g1_i1.p1 TRINITY_DN12876_c0_g1~~TRINITY_DN12876_c0_g1_i1.p1  ORF type:complete len:160 (+),score=26.05 TRINITY_DN12876_c0_g1_i1:68-547(+)